MIISATLPTFQGDERGCILYLLYTYLIWANWQKLQPKRIISK